MLAILLSYIHNIYNFIILLFFPPTVYCCASFPSYTKRVWQTLPLPMTFIPLNLLLPLLPWFFCCLSSFPAGKEPFFFLTEISASFLFELAHSLLITIDYFWLLFLLICEMYASELNAVLYKSMYQPQKDYPYICLFFFKRLSLFWAMVWFDLLFQIVCVWGREEWFTLNTI